MEESTRFSSLPYMIKLDIVKMLAWKDKLNARLVNREWFNLVNYKLTSSVTISDHDKSLEAIQSFLFSNVKALTVKNLDKKDLPIASSTRIGIPIANNLVLHSGISKDNLIKLLQSYAVSCRKLELKPDCLANLVCPGQINKTRANFYLANVTVLCFELNYFHGLLMNLALNRGYQNASQQHLHFMALEQVLRNSSFPNLTTFKIHVDVHPPLEDPAMSSTYQDFVDSFGKFTEKHGSKIKKFGFSNHGVFCFPIFTHFNKLVNVEHLQFLVHYVNDLLQPNIGRDLELAMKMFRKLKSLNFLTFGVGTTGWDDMQVDLSPHTKLASMLVENNCGTLESITKYFISMDATSSIDWLHKYQCPNLRVLDLVTNVYPEQFSTLLNLKLTSVVKLYLGILPSDVDWRDQVCSWIPHVLPNLKFLALKYEPQFMLRLSHLQMILQAKSLKKITLCSNWFEQIHVDALTWLESNTSQIEVFYPSLNICVLKVRRPFCF